MEQLTWLQMTLSDHLTQVTCNNVSNVCPAVTVSDNASLRHLVTRLTRTEINRTLKLLRKLFLLGFYMMRQSVVT